MTAPFWIGPAPRTASGNRGCRSDMLTSRQLEIAVLVARGFTNREIAEELVLAEGSVADHLERILCRLRLRCRTQLATCIEAAGLVACEELREDSRPAACARAM